MDDTRRPSSSSSLNKLLPKSITAKRRRRKENGSGNDDDGRGRPLSTSRIVLGSEPVNLYEDDGLGYSPYESEHEEFAARPGAMSTHPSQIGYLTTSSPVVQATHLPDSQPSITDTDSNNSTPAVRKSFSLPSHRSDSADSKDSKDSRLGRSKTGLLPPHNPTRRSPSPGSRIKGIFRPRKASNSSNASPERRPSSDQTRPSDIGRLQRQQQQQHHRRERQDSTALNDAPEPFIVPPVLEPPSAAKVASPSTRVKVQPKIDTTVPPRTPPSGDKPAPVIVNTPPTPTDHSKQASPDKKTFPVPSPTSTANDNSSPRGTNAHRRSRSASITIGPSKLSSFVTHPLSPTPESGEPTPTANLSSGFFSSMISAAQNAATSFSNLPTGGIGIGANKNRGGPPKAPGPERTDSQTVVPPETAPAQQTNKTMEQKDSAVRTLGAGELSLSQLGLSEPSSSMASPISSKFPEPIDTRARSESAPVESPIEMIQEGPGSRPRSLYESAASRGHTPPPGYDVENRPHRSSSLRSAVKPHRKRGSSVTTGTTIGAAISAANTSLTHPAANASVPKLTGFAIASKKRNHDFHNLFKSVPDDDYLIEDYSCALQREILAHGRLYVSEGHLCFSSNILGWTTTLVMSFDEIVSVEKRSTALLFKNGLMISTLHAKHVFASFTSRDATYDLIVNIWKLGHPTLKSTLNGVQVEGTGGDKTEKVEDMEESVLENDTRANSGSEDDEDSDDDFYDEDLHEELHGTTQATDVTNPEPEMEKSISRKASGISPQNGNGQSSDDATAAPGGGPADFPGPTTHAPTDCGDTANHYDRIVGDDVIPAPIGKIYSLLFGQASVSWMANWLTGEQKCTDLQMEDKKGLSLENRSRNFTYIKPLNAPIGPKQTKCIVCETVENLDFEKAINLTVSTQTPDVPSGNVFSVKTKYCLSWAENNATRVQINCTIEWTGKSWLKGPIEKGATDGQIQFCKDLFAALKAAVSSRPRSNTGNGAGKANGRKRGKKSKSRNPPADAVQADSTSKRAVKDWGMLEPIRGVAEPVVDMIQPLLTSNIMYGLIVGLLLATWFRSGLSPSRGGHDMSYYRPDRLAAYEEMWRREETELWDWLEERVRLDHISVDKPPVMRKKAVNPRTVEEKLREERMDELEVREAIRVTDEKLRVLRGVIRRKQKEGREADEGTPEEDGPL